MEERCSKTVYPNERYGGFHGHRCNRKATVERDGKSYCHQHDPEQVKKRQYERTAKWQAEREAQRKYEQDKIDKQAKLEKQASLGVELARLAIMEHAITGIFGKEGHKYECEMCEKAREILSLEAKP